MSNIINTKKISAARRLADRFDFSEPKPEPETPKEWNDLPLLLNTKILSGMLHISMPTITKLVTSGELKACKIAGKWFIEKDDFKEFLRKKTASSTEVIT